MPLPLNGCALKEKISLDLLRSKEKWGPHDDMYFLYYGDSEFLSSLLVWCTFFKDAIFLRIDKINKFRKYFN
jgi:hypothetical protein